jgi:cell division protein FtsW (lipid II flippase)
MASYLSRNGAAIGALSPTDVAANVRLVGPLVLGWGVSILTLVLQRDVGEAILFLGIFLVMLYAASRRIDLVVGAALVFGLGAWFVASHFAYVQARIGIWQDPWSDPLGRGYQAEQALFALANGGLFGAGYHLGHPGFIPDAATDYVYAAWAEEFGVAGAISLLAIYLAFVVRGMRIAFYATDRFTALLATGFSATLAIQVFVIVGGVLGLMPLTGITLPFFSYGGSSMVANIIMVDLLWLFSRREGDAQPGAKVAIS